MPDENGRLTEADIVALINKFGTMKAAEIKAELTPEVAAQLSAENLMKLTPAQFAEMTPEAMAALTPQSIVELADEYKNVVPKEQELNARRAMLPGYSPSVMVEKKQQLAAINKVFGGLSLNPDEPHTIDEKAYKEISRLARNSLTRRFILSRTPGHFRNKLVRVQRHRVKAEKLAKIIEAAQNKGVTLNPRATSRLEKKLARHLNIYDKKSAKYFKKVNKELDRLTKNASGERQSWRQPLADLGDWLSRKDKFSVSNINKVLELKQIADMQDMLLTNRYASFEGYKVDKSLIDQHEARRYDNKEAQAQRDMAAAQAKDSVAVRALSEKEAQVRAAKEDMSKACCLMVSKIYKAPKEQETELLKQAINDGKDLWGAALNGREATVEDLAKMCANGGLKLDDMNKIELYSLAATLKDVGKDGLEKILAETKEQNKIKTGKEAKQAEENLLLASGLFDTATKKPPLEITKTSELEQPVKAEIKEMKQSVPVMNQ